MNVEEIIRARKDLQKRLLVDIRQFEEDTGVRVSQIDMHRITTISSQDNTLVNIVVRLEIPQ